MVEADEELVEEVIASENPDLDISEARGKLDLVARDGRFQAVAPFVMIGLPVARVYWVFRALRELDPERGSPSLRKAGSVRPAVWNRVDRVSLGAVQRYKHDRYGWLDGSLGDYRRIGEDVIFPTAIRRSS